MVDLACSIPHYMEQRICRKMAGRGLRIRRSGVRIAPGAPIKLEGYGRCRNPHFFMEPFVEPV